MKPSKKLEELNASSYNYSVAVKDTFDSICQPLYNLGVPFFDYDYVFKNGTHFCLNSDLVWQKIYLASVEKVDKDFVEDVQASNRIFLKTGTINKYNKKDYPIKHILNDFNIWHTLSIYEKYKDSFAVYSFSLNKNFNNPVEFYLNILPLLEKFVVYFNDKAGSIIDVKDKKKLAYWNQSFQFHGKSEENLFEEKIRYFLQETTEKKQMLKGKYKMVRLSPREIECLNYLTFGYGIKGVASILGLSPRTVETYINNAKQKTHFYTRQELLTGFISSFKPSWINEGIRPPANKELKVT